MAAVSTLGGVADPRLGHEVDAIGSYKYDGNTGHNIVGAGFNTNGGPDVCFEEYHYWAERARAYEKNLSNKGPLDTALRVASIGGRKSSVAEKETNTPPRSELQIEADKEIMKPSVASDSMPAETSPYGISDDDWHTAQRAARTATWGAVFYLITTDILGPFTVPWAISQLGYGPGAALYFVFAVLAAYSGVLIWKSFLGLDSEKYPVKNYGDIAYRLFGPWFKAVCDVLQSFQFFLGVVLLILTIGQSLSQMSVGPNGKTPLCFTVCLLIFTLIGFFLGQIRTLQKFGYVANVSVWLNLLTIFLTMGFVAHSPPNFAAVKATFGIDPGPIMHSAGVPPGLSLADNVNGLMNAVYSYGGATMFCELMAEMRRPWDFWKGLIMADLVIFLSYIIFGMYVYGFQGNYTYIQAYQGVDPKHYSWQTVGNTFQLITGMIAAALYGNIGIKVLYQSVGRRFLGFPALESKTGKWIWVATVPIYWAVAFVLAAAVPAVAYLSSFVGAVAIMQFSYTFPPLFSIAYNIFHDTRGTWDPTTRLVLPSIQGESKFGRYWRGFRQQLLMNSFNLIYFLGAAVTACLGLYASGLGMQESFSEATNVKSFSCDSPTG